MSTYYELLKVTPTAAAADIEAACDTLYNQWRRLATHHDPKVVDEANRALREVEQIRATLTDPAKRAGYDAGIGLSGSAGGLADPEAILRQAATPPSPRPAAQRAPAQPPAIPGARTCLQCGVTNGPNERFCGSCGASLVRKCPECENTYYVGQQVCGQCGFKYEVAERRTALRTEIAAQRTKLDEIGQALSRATADKQAAKEKPPGCGLQVVMLFGVVVTLAGVFSPFSRYLWENLFLVLVGLTIFFLFIYLKRSATKKAVAACDADIAARQAEYISAETKLKALMQEFHKLDNVKSGA